mgnify:FL=1
MKIELENIGLVEKAEIAIDGISVIAGENGSGKSTIGKALFSTFNGFFNLNEKVNQARMVSIRNIVNDFINQNCEVDFSLQLDFSTKIAEGILNKRDSFVKDSSSLKKFIFESLKNFSDRHEVDENEDDAKDEIETFLPKIQRSLSFSNLEIKEKILQDQLNEEFDHQVLNFNKKNENGVISLVVKNKPLKMLVSNDSVGGDVAVKIEDEIDLLHEVVYFDSPSVLDDLDNALSRYKAKTGLSAFLSMGNRFRPGFSNHFKHSDVLKKQLKRDVSRDPIKEMLTNEKLREILENINKAAPGNLSQSEDKYFYSANGNKVNIFNVSSGMKTFITIKRLLALGVLKEQSLMILDEPEVHLHPEWQVLFAKIIVLIQKTFDVNFLINTHSPYFMEAIDVYASKFDIRPKVKYYLSSKNESGNVNVEDVSNCLEKAYSHLARPFQDLENIRYGNGI